MKLNTSVMHVALAALVLVCSTSASAQVTGSPTPGSDIVVMPNVMPSSVSAYQPGSLVYAVTNNGPPFTGVGSNVVKLHIDLTGLVPFNAGVDNQNGGSCTISHVNSVTGYSTIDCTATVNWGSTMFVDVYFSPASTSDP